MPIYNKGKLQAYDNYQAITILNAAYKVSVLSHTNVVLLLWRFRTHVRFRTTLLALTNCYGKHKNDVENPWFH